MKTNLVIKPITITLEGKEHTIPDIFYSIVGNALILYDKKNNALQILRQLIIDNLDESRIEDYFQELFKPIQCCICKEEFSALYFTQLPIGMVCTFCHSTGDNLLPAFKFLPNIKEYLI